MKYEIVLGPLAIVVAVGSLVLSVHEEHEIAKAQAPALAAPAAPVLFAAPTQPTRDYAQPSWGNGRTLVLDPQVTACAQSSDANDCSASCGAPGTFQGPCVHWSTFLNRWGGTSPYFTKSTLVSIESNHNLASDPIDWTPIIGSGTAPVDIGIQASSYGTLLGSSTLTNVTQLNAPTQIQSAQCSTFTSAIGLLIVNTTRSSVAWTSGLNSGNIYYTTAPLTQAAPPLHLVNGDLGEDGDGTGWVNGNSCSVYQPQTVVISRIRPQWSRTSSDGGLPDASSLSLAQQLYVWRFSFIDPNKAFATMQIGDGVQLIESISPTGTGSTLNVQTSGLLSPNGGEINYLSQTADSFQLSGGGIAEFPGGQPLPPTSGTPSINVTTFSGRLPGAYNNQARHLILGGGLAPPSITSNIKWNIVSSNYALHMDADWQEMPAADVYLSGTGTLGSIELEAFSGNNCDWWCLGGKWMMVASGTYVNGQFWGAATAHMLGQCEIDYTPPASGVFFLRGGSGNGMLMNSNSAQTACSETYASPDVISCGISVTNAHLAAAAGIAGFGDKAFILGGSILAGAVNF
jgi:hypothetical protein